MAGRSEATIVVEKGASAPGPFPLSADICVVGSGSGADLAIDNPYVSRLHARIAWEQDSFHISDLGSKNGTAVNGVAVAAGSVALKHGDRIELARGQVVLRFQEQRRTLTLGVPVALLESDLVVDAASRQAWVRGALLEPPLTRKEFDVLELLYSKRGAACSRDEIARTGWPERSDADVGDHEIDQCVRRLRLRIEADPARPRYVVTVRGYGYRMP